LSTKPPINPATKVAALLEHYPELEEVLIEMAPPFVKLRNPLLRRSVAKVASLRQAAAVGRLPVDTMVDQLRAAVGQPPLAAYEHVGSESYFTPQPDWFGDDRVVVILDERDMDPSVMPLNPLLRRATKMAAGEILELVTTFLPAPGIDILRNKGFATWTAEDDGLVHTYVCRIPSRS